MTRGQSSQWSSGSLGNRARDLLTTAQVARWLGISPRTICYWVLGSSIMGGTQFSGLTSAIAPHGRIYVAGNSGMPDTPLSPGVLFSPAVAQRTTSGIFLLAFDPSLTPATSQVSCAVDPATTALVGPVAPGQLITLFGTNIGPTHPVNGLTGNSSAVPVLLGGVSITFDGTPAPLLYVSANQVNLQVPFEVMHGFSTLMQMRLNGALIASRVFVVTPRNPSLFITPGNQIQQCSHTGSNTLFTVVAALADGSPASCSNPAPPGSSVAVFINGLGVDALNQVTGSITSPSPAELDVPFDVVTASGSLQADTLTDMPNTISGVGRLSLQIPNPAPEGVELAVRINGEDASPFTFSRLNQLAQILAVLWITP